jgi:hypothetical protein
MFLVYMFFVWFSFAALSFRARAVTIHLLLGYLAGGQEEGKYKTRVLNAVGVENSISLPRHLQLTAVWIIVYFCPRQVYISKRG